MANTIQKESKIIYLQIGQNYENLGVQKQFDVSEWTAEFPDAHIYLLFKRPGEEAAAPVNTTLDEDGILTWTVSNWETGIIGIGFAEIRAIDSSTGLVKKSHVIPCSIEASVTDEDAAPDYPSWVDRMLRFGENVDSIYATLPHELEEGIASIQQEAQTQTEAIEQKGITTRASIPSDYTTLSDDVTSLKSALQDITGETKNLLSIEPRERTVFGVSVKSLGYGRFSLNGTATSSGGRTYGLLVSPITLQPGTYRFSVYSSVTTNATFFLVDATTYDSIKQQSIVSSESGIGGSFTLSETKNVNVSVGVINGTTYDCTFEAQIEKGTTTTPFELAIGAVDRVARGNIADADAEINQLTGALQDTTQILIDINGIDESITPNKIAGLNCVTNGTSYTSNSRYETFYFPITTGATYIINCQKISGSPGIRIAVSQEAPAAGVTCAFLAEQSVPSGGTKYLYLSTNNGFLSVSAWESQVDVSATVKKDGEIDTVNKRINKLEIAENNTILIGNAARPIILETPSVKARNILYYEGEETPATWPGGLAIYKNMVFIGYNDGYVGVFDLTTNDMIAFGRSPVTNSHNNNLCFDYNIINGDFPILYISYCKTGYTYCHAFSLDITGTTLNLTQVQRVEYSGSYFSNNDSVDWSLTENGEYLVAIIGDNTGNDKILKFQKPDINSTNVTLSDTDIISSTSTNILTTRQANVITGDIMLILDGTSNGNLYAINLNDGTTVNSFSLSPMSGREPEGITVSNGKVYINFHIGQNVVSANLFELRF